MTKRKSFISDEMVEMALTHISPEYIEKTYKLLARSNYLKTRLEIVLSDECKNIMTTNKDSPIKYNKDMVEGMAKKTDIYLDTLKQYLEADKNYRTMEKNTRHAQNYIDLYRTEESGRRSTV